MRQSSFLCRHVLIAIRVINLSKFDSTLDVSNWAPEWFSEVYSRIWSGVAYPLPLLIWFNFFCTRLHTRLRLAVRSISLGKTSQLPKRLVVRAAQLPSGVCLSCLLCHLSGATKHHQIIPPSIDFAVLSRPTYKWLYTAHRHVHECPMWYLHTHTKNRIRTESDTVPLWVQVEGPKEEPKLTSPLFGFTTNAEIWNSRAAMIGLFSCVILEAVSSFGRCSKTRRIWRGWGCPDLGKGFDLLSSHVDWVSGFRFQVSGFRF